jgi:hypothetical protein
MNNPDFVFTGMGHSGTGYIHKLLLECGINCGHERVFSLKLNLFDEPYYGDSSHYFFEYAHLFPDIKIFYQIRDPVKVLKSYKESDPAKLTSPYGQWMRNQRYWTTYEEMIEFLDSKIRSFNPILTYNIEDLNISLLRKIFELLERPFPDMSLVKRAFGLISKRYNSHIAEVPAYAFKTA